MDKIIPMRDRNGNIIYPETSDVAVKMEDGSTLRDTIEMLKSSATNINTFSVLSSEVASSLNSWHDGVGTPDNSLGDDSDYYLQLEGNSAGDIYKKIQGYWERIGNIKGDIGQQGPKGEQGLAGPAGPRGITGDSGKKGDTGPQGIRGSRWYDGIGAPPLRIGEEYDYFLDIDSGDIYKRTFANWLRIGSIGNGGSNGSNGGSGHFHENLDLLQQITESRIEIWDTMPKDGERGPQGPKGDPGENGADGKDGSGVNITGVVDTKEELDSIVGTKGDGYVLDGILWVWNTLTNTWKESGPIQGPQGPPGETAELIAENISYTTTADNSILTVKDALDKLLYVAVSITSFSLSKSVAERGESVSNIVLSWSINKTVTSLKLDTTPIDTNLRQYTYPEVIISNKTFRLDASDGKTNVNKTTSINFYNGRYHGVSSEDMLYDSDFIKTLTKTLTDNRANTFTVNCGEGQYIYFCIPSRLGTPTFTVGGFTGGFAKIKTISFNNNFNFTEAYDIWKSSNSGLGNTTVVVG